MLLIDLTLGAVRNAVLAGLLVLPASVVNVSAQSAVDTALILAVDVSNSVDARRYSLQVEGIADALEDPSVQSAILGGPLGSIAITVILWADRPHLSLPWVRIASAGDALALAGRVRQLSRQGGEFTCVSQMMRFVADKITPQIPVQATRVVLDVSGDGRDNCNPKGTPAALRDELIEIGVTINGLPILDGAQAASLADWYHDNVIGGPGAFLLPADGFEDFGRAFRQKFMTEVSMVPAARKLVRLQPLAAREP